MRHFTVFSLMGLILLVASTAFAEEGDEHHGDSHSEHPDGQHGDEHHGDEHHGDEHHGEHADGHSHSEHSDGHRFFLGAKASYMTQFAHGHVNHLAGGGVFFEVLAIPNWLEIELFGRVMGGGDLMMFPIDLVLKKPFHINETVHPFIGIGATVVPTIIDDKTEVFFGGLVAVGSYFWLTQTVGIVAELNYNLVYEHGIANEVGVNAGIVLGF